MMWPVSDASVQIRDVSSTCYLQACHLTGTQMPHMQHLMVDAPRLDLGLACTAVRMKIQHICSKQDVSTNIISSSSQATSAWLPEHTAVKLLLARETAFVLRPVSRLAGRVCIRGLLCRVSKRPLFLLKHTFVVCVLRRVPARSLQQCELCSLHTRNLM